ncbi:MAG: hypothetical protein LBG19_13040 [Prevotellaceae bacterium]|jgi:hypothetical protein|nr:hypothetical protein [Prevotellaceae bacterium]
MKKIGFILFLMITAIYVQGQNVVQINDLAGKWKLAKIEEVQVKNDAEVASKSFTPSDYSNVIFFGDFEGYSDGKISYSVSENEPENIGNIQLNENSNVVFFHNKKIGSYPFDFGWRAKPTSFSIERPMKRNQQTKEKTLVRFYYEKQ